VRSERRAGLLLTGASTVLLMAGAARAVPIQVGVGAFSGAPQVDFNGLPAGELTNQFAGQGVTFSGGLYAFSNAAANFQGSVPGNVIQISFTSTMLRAGFDVTTQLADNLKVDVKAFLGGMLVTTGTFTILTPGTTQSFVGFEDSTGGIDNLVLTPVVGSGGSGRFLLDNLRFEPIPEPSTALLFSGGLLLLAARGTQRRRPSA